MSKRNFVFTGRKLDQETYQCTLCNYCTTIRATSNQERASYSFQLKIVSSGYEVGELNFAGVSYINYKFICKIIKRFNDEIRYSQLRPDIEIIEPYCELFTDPKTLHKCMKAPVALTEESIFDEIIQRRKHSPRIKR